MQRDLALCAEHSSGCGSGPRGWRGRHRRGLGGRTRRSSRRRRSGGGARCAWVRRAIGRRRRGARRCGQRNGGVRDPDLTPNPRPSRPPLEHTQPSARTEVAEYPALKGWGLADSESLGAADGGRERVPCRTESTVIHPRRNHNGGEPSSAGPGFPDGTRAQVSHHNPPRRGTDICIGRDAALLSRKRESRENEQRK